MIMNASDVGTQCPKCCQGVIHAYKSLRAGDRMVRYYACNHCRWKPEKNKLSVPIERREDDEPGKRRFRIKKRIW